MAPNLPQYQFIDERIYRRIIAIGDLHGHPGPLHSLLEIVKPGDDDFMIFIGDYIDRGPDAKAVVDLLLHVKQAYKNTVFLKGNHEDMMLGALGFPAHIQDIDTWMYNGGAHTLASYGMDRQDILRLETFWDGNERLREVMRFFPEGHIEFFNELYDFVESDSYFFCHAGIDPHVSVHDGKWNTYDLLWTREHIYAEHLNWEKIVVCGHTPLVDVLFRDKLICIDTGLYYFGKLSAVDVLTRELFQVTGS